MSKLSELRAERDRLATAAEALNRKYPGNKKLPESDGAELDAMLDRMEEIDGEIVKLHGSAADAGEAHWRGAGGSQVKVLRTPADFRAHYRARPGSTMAPTGQPFGLDEWLRGVAGMQTASDVRAALSEGTNTDGGYTVPNVLMPNIMEALVPASSLLQAGAGVVALDVGGKDFTTAAIDVIPTAAWRAEAGAISESGPTFRAVVATPRSLAFFFKISRELLADARNLSGALATVIAQSFAKELDRAGLRGSGTPPEPRGILNTTNVNAVTNGANGASLATTAYANFISALQGLLAADAPMPNAAIMAPRSLTTLAGLLDTTNQPRQAPAAVGKLQMLTSSQIPTNLTVGTSTDCSEIYIGDFSKVAFMLRENVSIMLAKELYAGTGQLAFFGHVRADIAVWYPKAFAVVTGVRA